MTNVSVPFLCSPGGIIEILSSGIMKFSCLVTFPVGRVIAHYITHGGHSAAKAGGSCKMVDFEKL